GRRWVGMGGGSGRRGPQGHERLRQSSACCLGLTPGPAGLSASLSPQPTSPALGLRLPPSAGKKVHLGYHGAYSYGEPTMITTVTLINDGFRPRTREQVGPPADDFIPTAHEVLPPTRRSAQARPAHQRPGRPVVR